ncbi:MAG: hypothetical protein NT166_18235 [Candidatus Aminicenantes bacterium]|nr:hypothetical protein [Candidatus Aminicenantes bacterium]
MKLVIQAFFLNHKHIINLKFVNREFSEPFPSGGENAKALSLDDFNIIPFSRAGILPG